MGRASPGRKGLYYYHSPGRNDWWLLRHQFTKWVRALEEWPWVIPKQQVLATSLLHMDHQRRSYTLGQGVKLALLLFLLGLFSVDGFGFEDFYFSLVESGCVVQAGLKLAILPPKDWSIFSVLRGTLNPRALT